METSSLLTSPAIAYIRLLSTQLNELYRSMKIERQALAEWEESQDISILGVLELFSSDIQGYVEQMSRNVVRSNPVATLHHLRQLNVLEIDYFAPWYFSNLTRYPQIRQYIEQLDHLRLLLIEQLNADLPIAG
jgi:hypothetical protein